MIHAHPHLTALNLLSAAVPFFTIGSPALASSVSRGSPAVMRQASIVASDARWGTIANRSHLGQPLFTALFFAGPPNPRFLSHYTRHPLRSETLEGYGERDMGEALEPFRATGLNVIELSFWGYTGETDAWSPTLLFSRVRWPSASSPTERRSAEDVFSEKEQVDWAKRFFRAARRKGLLVAPLLEVSPRFPFWSDFPDRPKALVERSAWLLRHLGNEPNWLRLHDREGRARQALWLIESIHGEAIDPERFAAGFDAAANWIESVTGKRVGFLLDPTPLPAGGSHHGPTPETLRRRSSVLAICPFNITSEGIRNRSAVRDGASNGGNGFTEEERFRYAESILQHWSVSGIPLIAPILPGYDARSVFPGAGIYGFNPIWRLRQKELALRYATAGISVNCWNGWTEGYAIPPSVEDGSTHMEWVSDVIRAYRKRDPSSPAIRAPEILRGRKVPEM